MSLTPLPALTTIEAALAPGAVSIIDDESRNICLEWQVGDKGATDAAMACLHLVTDRSRKNLRSLYDDGVRAETIRSSLAHFLEEPAAESDRMLEMPRLLSD